MKHAFLLFVFLGVGEDKKLVSNDMYFADLNECVYFSQKLHKQGENITSYCLPKMVDENVRIY
tara:strand:+ start:1234 stop:1422 length:189 start_codon:yes stop_codon:yes gene_type:complete